MKICLVATFPPSGRQLNEYAFHIARELRRCPGVELTILADELTDYQFVTDQNGAPIESSKQAELPEFDVVRCWRFGDFSNPLRLLRTIRRLNPDVVWFNLVFSTFATPELPFAAFAGLSAPALIRAAGYYTHITLHHIIEHVDFSTAGVRHERIYRFGTQLATRALLKADSVSVLLPGYYRTLMSKYSAKNILLGTHGTFSPVPCPPDFSRRGNPDQRILAIGHWGTYKRLEVLMEAFPLVLKKAPRARLIVGGANHHTRPGYWESIRAQQAPHLPVEFRGYVPEEEIPDLFQTSSVVVLPYDSATGSSGPAHQACEFGVPIVSAQIPDFQAMAASENIAIRFYRVGDAADLADQLLAILQSHELEHQMAEHNFAVGLEMAMGNVIRHYLRWFELHRLKNKVLGKRIPRRQGHQETATLLGTESVPSDLGAPTQ